MWSWAKKVGSGVGYGWFAFLGGAVFLRTFGGLLVIVVVCLRGFFGVARWSRFSFLVGEHAVIRNR